MTNSDGECTACDPRAGAVALGRWCLGILFLFFGIGKLSNVSGFAESLGKQFEKTWLPAALLSIFGHMLPYLETILGVLLLLGLFRDLTLFAAGLLLIALTFGQVLLGNGQVVFFNTCYVFLSAGLLFFSKYDRWVLLPRFSGCQQSSQTPAPEEQSSLK